MRAAERGLYLLRLPVAELWRSSVTTTAQKSVASAGLPAASLHVKAGGAELPATPLRLLSCPGGAGSRATCFPRERGYPRPCCFGVVPLLYFRSNPFAGLPLLYSWLMPFMWTSISLRPNGLVNRSLRFSAVPILPNSKCCMTILSCTHR